MVHLQRFAIGLVGVAVLAAALWGAGLGMHVVGGHGDPGHAHLFFDGGKVVVAILAVAFVYALGGTIRRECSR